MQLMDYLEYNDNDGLIWLDGKSRTLDGYHHWQQISTADNSCKSCNLISLNKS